MADITALDIIHIEDWMLSNFGPAGLDTRSAVTVTAGMTEEVGELMRCVTKLEQGIRGTREEWLAEMKKEIGDVFIKLVDIADWYAIDILEAIHNRFYDDIQPRDWVKDQKGHGISNG